MILERGAPWGELLKGVGLAEHSLSPARLTLADAKANPGCILSPNIFQL